MNALGVDVSREGGIVIVRLSGEIDLDNTLELSEALEAAISPNDEGLVLDLSGVRYIDSGGIRVLFKLARALADDDRGFAVAVPEASTLRKLLKVTRLEAAAAVYSSIPAALDAVMVQPED